MRENPKIRRREQRRTEERKNTVMRKHKTVPGSSIYSEAVRHGDAEIIPLMSKWERKEGTKERAEVAEKGLKVMNSAEMQRECMKQWV